MSTDREKIKRALEIAKSGGFDGSHHKMWVIDQIVRALTDCPIECLETVDCNNKPYTYEGFGESDEYKEWVRGFCNGEDGPETYEWDVGIPP